MEKLSLRLQSRTSQESVEYLLKYGQLVLTILAIVGILLWIGENPYRIKSSPSILAAAS